MVGLAGVAGVVGLAEVAGVMGLAEVIWTEYRSPFLFYL